MGGGRLRKVVANGGFTKVSRKKYKQTNNIKEQMVE